MKAHLLQFSIISCLLVLYGCNDQDGFPGASNNIADSKKRGVFVSEYTCYPNPYWINDTLKISVMEAWVEKFWRHTNNKNGAKILVEDNLKYQICVNTIESDLAGIHSIWSIGMSNKYLHISSRNSLSGDFVEMPNDTLDYIVHVGDYEVDTSGRNFIGHFILVKK